MCAGAHSEVKINVMLLGMPHVYYKVIMLRDDPNYAVKKGLNIVLYGWVLVNQSD